MNIKQLKLLCESVGDKFIMHTTTNKIIINCSKCKIDYFIKEDQYIKLAQNNKLACPICSKLETLHKQDKA